MKNQLIAIAGSMMLAACLMAQTGRGGNPPSSEEMIQMRVERLTRLLDLNATQQQQVKQIFTEEAATLQPMLERMREAGQAMQAAIKSGNESGIDAAAQQQGATQTQIASVQGRSQLKIRSILTDTQKQTFDSMPGGGRMMGPGGPGGGRFGGRQQ